jgi:hypothetical protein
LKKLGYQRQDHQISSIKYIQDVIKNIKDLKVYGIENKFYNYFFYEAKKYSEIEQNVNFLSAIPKYFIEFTGILVFVCVFQLFTILNFSSDDIIIIIGILAASALKILPSINRIMNSSIKIKYSFTSVNTIYKESVYPTAEQALQILLTTHNNAMKGTTESGRKMVTSDIPWTDIDGMVKFFSITQKELLQIGEDGIAKRPGVYYNFVCRKNNKIKHNYFITRTDCHVPVSRC